MFRRLVAWNLRSIIEVTELKKQKQKKRSQLLITFFQKGHLTFTSRFLDTQFTQEVKVVSNYLA